MQPSCQQPRHLRRWGQQVRRNLKELSLSKLSRLLPNFSDRTKQNVDGQRGRVFHLDTSDAVHYRQSSSTRSGKQLAPSARRLCDHERSRVSSSSRTLTVSTFLELPDPKAPVISNTSPEGLDLDEYLSSGLDILLKLPGDGPEQTHQAAASIDTQLVNVNLMRREVWEERLNGEGRGQLESDNDAYVTTMKSDRIPIIGVTRGVEWHFKNGSRTYTSDFHVIDMERFDVLLGSDTIRQYQLVELGPDVRHHLQRRATITTSASNPKGYGHNVTLHAIIDEAIEESLISRKRLEQLQDWLKVCATPLGVARTLRDSCDVSYEAQSKVCLLVKPCDGTRTETFWFYIAETKTAHFAGGHDIILAKSWETKFPMDTHDGRMTYPAAPTVYRKGRAREWEKNASRKSKKNLEEATLFEADWEKDAKEQKEKGKGPTNGQ
ncbi:hypothetical protein BDW66DRAFT_154224 [Aspergillus desertorum]